VDPSREVSSSIALYPWLVVFVTPLRTAVLLVRFPFLSYAYAHDAVVAPALVFSVAVISRFRVSYPKVVVDPAGPPTPSLSPRVCTRIVSAVPFL